MKKIFHNPKKFRNLDEERMKACKKLTSLLPTLASSAQEPEDKFPDALRKKLVNGIFGFLARSFAALSERQSSYSDELRSQVMKMFNECPPALHLTAKYFSFKDQHDYDVAGGKRKFDLLMWCSKSGIHLDEKKFNLLCDWKNSRRQTDLSKFYARLCKAAGDDIQI